MALYHLTAKTGTRATGASALAKAQYIQREAHYARVPDAVAFTTSRNLPSFAGGSAAAYWDAADLYERANGRLFKEVEFALPIELPAADQRALAESFAEELTAGEPLPYTLAIHEGRGHNPHCHVLLSERVNDGVEREASQWFRRWNERSPEQGGARKSRTLHPRAWLEAIREKWAELVNHALERAGFRERVDHRSLAEQGIERTAQIHLGPNVLRMKSRGLGTDRADEAERIAARNRALADRSATARTGPETREQDPPRAPAHRESGSSAEHEPGDRGPAPAEAELRGRQSPVPPTNVQAPERAASPNLRARTPERGESERTSEEQSSPAKVVTEPDRRGQMPTTPTVPDVTDRSVESTDARRSRAFDLTPDTPKPETRPPVARERENPTGDPEPPRDSHVQQTSTPEAAIDRTERAVLQQLRAMDCEVLEIGIRERSTGRMLERTWSPELVLQSLPFLKRMNALGNDIFVRPAEHLSRHGLVLLDDLTPSALGQLERDGRRPALVVETSPGNYQAWIRVPDRTTDPERAELARRLAREYDADPGSASARPYGRLAGFTNRKESYRSPDGLHPFALLRSASGREAPDGERLRRQAARALREQERTQGSPPDVAASPGQPTTEESRRRAVELYRSYMDELQTQTRDLSRCDFTAAVRLVALGYDAATVRQAVREASPNLDNRKRGHVDDYVQRTVDVAIRFHDRQRGRHRGRERDRDGPER